MFYKKSAALLLAVVMALALLTACGKQTAAPAAEVNDIIVLYTNDVHCGIDENIGYAGLAAYKAAALEKPPYVALVDCGDAIQGDVVGTVSKGEYPVDLMNDVGYDFAVLGNHEFDCGMTQLKALIEKSSAQYLAANITYTGSGESAIEKTKPYEIVEYGDKKVAFIGVSTPHSITSSTPSYFMDENGSFVYDFCGGDSIDKLAACVQGYVDECRTNGADYVIVCAHLGDGEGHSPFTSTELISSTTGIDALLDGHSHSVVSCRIAQNKNGEDVVVSQTGTKLANIGQLVITSNGNISTGLISDYAQKDADEQEYVDEIKERYEADTKVVVATSDIALSCSDANGFRLVRNRETAIGDFCADAYRAVAKADIAFVNGGGIRADLPMGYITYGDLIAVHPFGNTLCSVKATGQQVLDALEMSARFTQAEQNDGKLAVGESGGFLQVSGLKFTIDTSIASSITTDENDMFVSVDGERRVKDVMVLGKDGEYTAIDPAAEYTVASHNYLMQNGGDGMNMFMNDEFIINSGMIDSEILISYITENLDGKLGELYSSTGDRITIK